jgi:hypothetical protein
MRTCLDDSAIPTSPDAPLSPRMIIDALPKLKMIKTTSKQSSICTYTNLVNSIDNHRSWALLPFLIFPVRIMKHTRALKTLKMHPGSHTKKGTKDGK